MSQDLIDDDKYQQSLQQLEKMQENVHFTTASPKQSLWKDVLAQVPFVAEFLQRVDDTGQFTGFLLETSSHPSSGVTEMTKGFHFVHLGFALIDFFKIPVMYISAYILGRDIPFKLSRMGKWAFSAVVVALMIAATVNPAIAPVLLVVVSALGLGLAVYTLERYFRRRTELVQEERLLARSIAEMEEKLGQQQQHALTFSQLLNDALQSGDVEEAERLHASIADLKMEYQQTIDTLQQDHLKHDACKQKLTKYDTKAVVSKAVVVVVSTLVVLGLGLSLAFPPLGMGLAAAGTFIGLSYMIGSYLGPKLYNRFSKKTIDEPGIDASIDRLLFDEEEIINVEKTMEDVSHLDVSNDTAQTPGEEDSTMATIGLLNSEHLEVSVLKEQLLEPGVDHEEIPAFKTSAPETPKDYPLPTQKPSQETLSDEDEGEGEGEEVKPD